MGEYGMATFKFTKIEKHPLRDCYMLYSDIITSIPPIFGSFDECERSQVYFEEKSCDIFNNLPITDKGWVLDKLRNEEKLLCNKK